MTMIGLSAVCRRTITLLLATVLSVASLVGLAPAAHAINEVSGPPCETRTDFAKAWMESGLRRRCWANAGAMSVHYRRISRLCSGNNVVTWTIWPNATTATQVTTQRRECHNLRGTALTRVSIR